MNLKYLHNTYMVRLKLMKRLTIIVIMPTTFKSFKRLVQYVLFKLF